MVSVVVRSNKVAERVRELIRQSAAVGYHGGLKYNQPVLDSYYVGDEANGVMVTCEPVGDHQRVLSVNYCQYDPPAILEEGVFIQ